MLTKRLTVFAGMTGILISGGLKWNHPLPVMGAHLVPRLVSPKLAIAPASLQVAQPTQSKKRHLSSEAFIPTNLKQSENPHPGSRNIFGKDARIPMTATDYPWSAIGRLEARIDEKTVARCTGTLISKQLVITNAHCVFDEQGKLLQQITFSPNLTNGKAKDSATVTDVLVGTKNPQQEESRDWAILTLDQPLGNKYGWMSWITLDFADLDSLRKKFILAGYSHDFPAANPGATAGVHKGCSIRGFDSKTPGVITHDCDTTRGSSGGPIFVFYKGKPVIVALNEAERSLPGDVEHAPKFAADTANFGVLTSNWAEAASELTVKAH